MNLSGLTHYECKIFWTALAHDRKIREIRKRGVAVWEMLHYLKAAPVTDEEYEEAIAAVRELDVVRYKQKHGLM